MKTREEFSDFLLEEAKKMFENKSIQDLSHKFLSKADKYSWIHQTSWLGEPSLQLPQDLFAIQEIFYKARPTIVIESGVAWGGTALFLMSLAQSILGEKEYFTYIGVDKIFPNDVRLRLSKVIEEKTHLIEGSYYGFIEGNSVNESTHSEISNFLDYFYDYSGTSPGLLWKKERKIVILDSCHTHKHVLEELRIFSEKYEPEYIIVCDTIIEDIENPVRKRIWGKGNSPRTAIQEFLLENKKYEVDKEIMHKLLLSCQPDGYLKRV